MREVELRVQVTLPQATELIKLENKSLVRNIHIGRPTLELQRTFGPETRIQINDAFVDAVQVQEVIIAERSAMPERDQGQMIVSIRADKDTRMGIITDVKQSLRRAYALRVNYNANQLTNVHR